MVPRQRILIVDDTPENIRVLKESLGGDHAILAATGGDMALRIAAKDPRPDLVLLDVMMPGMDGYEVCRRLKEDPTTRDIPVIFVTALTDAGEEARGLELGAVDYVTKPFEVSLVKARVRNQLQLKRHRDRLEELVEERTRDLLETTAAKERLETELELARELQRTMLPAGEASGDGWRITAVLEPAIHVGGDLFDYFLVGPDRLLFLLGDVSGKGVSAALFMVRALTVLRRIAATETAPAAILERANNELCAENDTRMFVTTACGILEPATGEAVLASAGHDPPVLVTPEGAAEFVDVPGSAALGMVENAGYREMRIRLEPGAHLVLYSDGVTEALDESERMFTDDRLRDLLTTHRGRDGGDLAGFVRREVREFAGGTPQSDDITILSIGSHGTGSP